MMVEIERCSSLLRSLVGALKKYDALINEISGEDEIPLEIFQRFLAQRQGALEEIREYITALGAYETLLNESENEELQSLKRRVLDLRTRTTRNNDRLFERLKAQRDVIAAKLKALTHAGHAMRGYGRHGPLPPRFLDSRN